jgi:glutathione S-transferase
MRAVQKSDMTPTSDPRGNRRRRVPEKKGHITIWGRANSVNVQKVLWCLSELDLAYERIDAGMAFGRNCDPEYLAMNPNARVPTLVDGDYVLWESHSIMRLSGARLSSGFTDLPPEQRDMVAIQKDADAEAMVWEIADAQLAKHRFLEGDDFTIADIAVGAFARRWLRVEGIRRPKLPNLDRWFAELASRTGFRQHLAQPLT